MSIFDFKTKANKDKKVDSKSAKVEGAPKEETKKQVVKDLYSGKVKDSSKDNLKKSSSVYKDAYKILVKPLVTEKATVLGAQNKYVFAVANSANKIEITKAISHIYGVVPKSVNVVRVGGKKTRTGRTTGKRKDWKKAIVTLPEGESIKIYEGV